MIINWSIQKAYRESKRRKRFHYYLDTNNLSPKMKVAIDIALECQAVLNDPSLFIPLRDLFKPANKHNENIRHGAGEVRGVMGLFLADEKGNFLSESEFAEILNGLPPMIRVASGVHVPQSMSEKMARQLGFAELVPIREEDFQLTEQQIKLLNTFTKDAVVLKNSSLYVQPSPVVFHTQGGKREIIFDITDEQFETSITRFRKLYMEGEPANFRKAVKILTNTQNITHPVVGYMNDQKKKYNDILSHKISEDWLSGHFVKDIPPEKLPTGEELLCAVMYTQYLHQGDDKTWQRYEHIRNTVQDDAVLNFVFYSVLHNLSKIIIYTGDWVGHILSKLGKLNFAPPARRIPDKVKKFSLFCDDKIWKLAETFWEEAGRPTERSVSDFQPQARAFLKDLFKQDLSSLGFTKTK